MTVSTPHSPHARFFALVPCAGSGSRAGTAIPKQYQPVAGLPMVRHTLAAFAAVPRIARCLVVVAPGDDFLQPLEPPFALAACGGATRAAAGEDEGARRAGQERRDLVDGALVDGELERDVGGDPRRLGERRGDVHRQRDDHRAALAGQCRRDRTAQQHRRVRRIGRLDGELAHVAGHADHVEAVARAVLQAALAVDLAGQLADQEQDRQAVAVGRREAGDRVQDPGPGRHRGDTEAAGRVRVAAGGEHRAALVARRDHPDVGAVHQRVEDGRDGTAREAEDQIDAGVAEHVDEAVGGAATPGDRRAGGIVVNEVGGVDRAGRRHGEDLSRRGRTATWETRAVR